MSLDCFDIAWRARGLDPIEKLALLFLADGVGGGGLISDNTPSEAADVAAFCEVTLERASLAIQSLSERGFLVRTINGIDRAGWRVVRPGAPPEVEARPAPRATRRDPVNVSVYVLAHNFPGSMTCKVGISNNPEKRCASVTSLTDLDLSVVHQSRRMTRAEAFRIEQRAHECLRAHRISGEFFSCGAGVAKSAVIALGGGA